MIAEKSLANIKRVQPRDVIDLVVKEIQTSEVTLSTWKRQLIKYNELYNLVQTKKHYEGLSNIFVPEILRAVETVVGKLYQVIAGQPDFFEYTGRDDYDEGPAIAMTQLVKYQMDENSFKSRLMDSLRQMVISGLTVRKILWDFQEVKRTRTNLTQAIQEDAITKKQTKSKKLERQPSVETVKDHWTFEPVDLLGFHISDVTTPYNDIQKAEWIAEQYIIDKSKIKEKIRKGWYAGEMYNEISAEEKASDSTYATLRDSRARAGGFQELDKKGKCEIIERWGLVPATWVMTPEEIKAEGLEDEDKVEAVVVIANRKAILKLEVNPFWHGQKPYVSCPYVPKEHEFSGIGITQIGEKLQEELNDTRNQTMDNKTLILMCMWLKHRGAGIRNSDLRVRPLGVVTTNDMTGLQPLRPPVLTGVGVNIEGVIKEDLRQSVGASSNMQGIAQAGVDSATEASLTNSEARGRLVLTAELYGELVLKPMLIFAEFNNYQFYDHVKVIKIVGPVGVKFRKLAPEELVGYKDVVIKLAVDASDNPAVRRQQIMNFLTIVQPMPPQMIQMHWKLLDKIYKMFFQGRSMEELYPTLAPVDPQELLTPEDEVDMVLAEQPVYAKQGQDHQAYLQHLVKEFDSMKYALSPKQFELFKALIISHQEAMTVELQAAQAQALMQQEQMMQTGGGGKVANASKDTISNPRESAVRQDVGV